jgi:hypothetical protein
MRTRFTGIGVGKVMKRFSQQKTIVRLRYHRDSRFNVFNVERRTLKVQLYFQ